MSEEEKEGQIGEERKKKKENEKNKKIKKEQNKKNRNSAPPLNPRYMFLPFPSLPCFLTLTSAPMTPRLVRRKYSYCRSVHTVLRNGYRNRPK